MPAPPIIAPASPRRFPFILYPLALIFCTLALFAPAFRFAFLNWDDTTNVYQNPYLNPVVTGASVAQFWRTSYFELYTPLTYTIWAACALFARMPAPVAVLGGGSATLSSAVFHAVGVAVHAANAVLVYSLLRRLVKSPLGAGLGALVWAVHPLQVEPVAWVTGHNGVFSGFFALLALFLYVRHGEEQAAGKGVISGAEGVSRRARARAARFYAVATLFYICALLAKPTAAAAPFVALALALHYRRPVRAVWPGLLVWLALAGGVALLTRATSTTAAGVHTVILTRPIIAGDALAFYAMKVLAPVAPLTIDYGRTPAYVLAHSWAYANAVAVAAFLLLAIAWYRKGRLRWPLVALALFIAGAFPVLGLVPFYFQSYSTVADRYVYLSLIGLGYAVATVVAQNENRERARSVPAVFLAVVFAGLLALRTFLYLPTFRDSITVFTNAVAVNPLSVAGHNNLGIALAERSETGAALQHAQIAARLRPGNAEATNNLGVAYGETGDMDGAVASFREAVRLRPDYGEAQYHLGVSLIALADASSGKGATGAAQNAKTEAVVHLREAVRLNPAFEEAHFRLAVLLARQGPGAAREAETEMRRVVALNPNRAEARYILGVLLANGRRNRDAEAEFRTTIRLTPNFADAHYNLGMVLLRQNRPADAVAPLADAVRLAPGNARARAALAQARGTGRKP